MTKLSQINEGLWSKGIERSKTDNERIEDKIDSNIDELIPVDLGFPFLIADKDFKIKDEKYHWFSYDDMKKYLKYFKKHGWRLLTNNEIKEYFLDETQHKKSEIILKFKANGGNKFSFFLQNYPNKNEVELSLDAWYGINYWINDDSTIVKFLNNAHGTDIRLLEIDKTDKCHIRLVKDK